jgi:arginine/ornithine N-succinyltransferase beta subunit
VLDVIRRELRRVSPDVKIESDQIRNVLAAEVIKREVMEGEKADEAIKKISKSATKALRATSAKKLTDGDNAHAAKTSEALDALDEALKKSAHLELQKKIDE